MVTRIYVGLKIILTNPTNPLIFSFIFIPKKFRMAPAKQMPRMRVGPRGVPKYQMASRAVEAGTSSRTPLT
jgi:hypothetical protein